MWGSSALDLATQGDCNSTARTLIQLNTFEGSTEHPEEKIQCPCGSNVKSDTMKQVLIYFSTFPCTYGLIHGIWLGIGPKNVYKKKWQNTPTFFLSPRMPLVYP